MKKVLLLIVYLICTSSPGYSQQVYWQQQVDYRIDVSLNDQQHTLDGFVKMDYFNNSPDTLLFIWIHLWPNAYKNDRTAFSDQLLENGRTDFYFSNADKRGYINRLDFKVNGIVAKTEDHPQHQDIIKLILPTPLAPKTQAKIQTPFHEQLPYNFSRGGHVGQSYQVTQWYPKPAVYDRKGWHPIPYLDQGEFYSEFGNFEVQITLPSNYVVAATGELQDQAEKDWLKQKAANRLNYEVVKKPVKYTGTKKKTTSETEDIPASSTTPKTLHYIQQNVHDFAWFADKRFALKQDTLQLKSGRVIQVATYWPNMPNSNKVWQNSINFLKRSILTRSEWLGEYPYQTATALEAQMGFAGGMEYPTITSISPMKTPYELEGTIEHEVGHNWNYGILGSNERDHAWMDEGINSFYDNRYKSSGSTISTQTNTQGKFFNDRLPSDLAGVALRTLESTQKDQPIETVSGDFTEMNYGLSAYYKTSQWIQLLEQELGATMFDSCMHEYYRRWQFKHPYPEDFRQVMETVSGKNLDGSFALLYKKGPLKKTDIKRSVKLASFFNLKDTDKYKYNFLSPLVGFNNYDKFMIGLAIHNYTLPAEKLQFLFTPLYATGSKQLNGYGKLNYHWAPAAHFSKIEIGLNGSRFSTKRSIDSSGKNIYENYSKLVPYLKFYFNTPARSHLSRWLDIRSFQISEKTFDQYDYAAGSDSLYLYPKAFATNHRYINQVSFNTINTRALYPYSYQLQLQQGKGFYRVNITGEYFFNYAKGGGMSARFFAAKFGYLGSNNRFESFQYQPRLLGGNGTDDYTYSNYFLGRSASTAYAGIPVANGGIAAQQIMIQNTGGLKFRLDPLNTQGQSENWVAAANFSTTLPAKLFPVKIPLKLFFDVGSYAEAWDKNSTATKFLYVGGIQLSLFKDVLNIYAPLVYSSLFRDYLKTDAAANKFSRKVTFSIDIQHISFKKLAPQFPF